MYICIYIYATMYKVFDIEVSKCSRTLLTILFQYG